MIERVPNMEGYPLSSVAYHMSQRIKKLTNTDHNSDSVTETEVDTIKMTILPPVGRVTIECAKLLRLFGIPTIKRCSNELGRIFETAKDVLSNWEKSNVVHKLNANT
uniref:Uncharacterized protein n=1 Tax=Bracon brevicornis TaxID=1563983 RepID=A0A6V7LAS0_9HYME